MAPPVADVDIASDAPVNPVPVKGAVTTSTRLTEPLKSTGSLDSYEQFDVTAVIGREFPALQLSSILQDDTKVRDLAILGWLPAHDDRIKALTPLQCHNAVLFSSVTRT